MAQLLKDQLGDYGDGISQWFLMFVILKPGSQGSDAPERVMYKKKSKELDMRLNVDFAAFKSGSDQARQQLLYSCMLRSLDLMAEKKIPQFDAVALKTDVEAVAVKEGWSVG
jgi:hypothetical protein